MQNTECHVIFYTKRKILNMPLYFVTLIGVSVLTHNNVVIQVTILPKQMSVQNNNE